MGFKDMVAEDLSSVFFNVEEFGEERIINDKPVVIVIDNDTLKEKQGGMDSAVAESSTLFFARCEDLPERQGPGTTLIIDGRIKTIDDWQENDGMATIALRENIAM